MNVNAPVLLFLCCCFCVLIDSFDLTWTFLDLEYNSYFFLQTAFFPYVNMTVARWFVSSSLFNKFEQFLKPQTSNLKP